jgi:predicted nucleotidyltransferase
MDRRKARLIEQLREFKQRNKVTKLYLFGSAASGGIHKWSDVDLLVVSRRFRGKGLLQRAPGLYMRWNLDYPVDFLCYSPEEFNRLRKQITIVKEAVESGIEI